MRSLGVSISLCPSVKTHLFIDALSPIATIDVDKHTFSKEKQKNFNSIVDWSLTINHWLISGWFQRINWRAATLGGSMEKLSFKLMYVIIIIFFFFPSFMHWSLCAHKGEFHKERVFARIYQALLFFVLAHRLMDACFECRTENNRSTHLCATHSHILFKRLNQCTPHHHRKWYDVVHLCLWICMRVCVCKIAAIFSHSCAHYKDNKTAKIKKKWIIETHAHTAQTNKSNQITFRNGISCVYAFFCCSLLFAIWTSVDLSNKRRRQRFPISAFYDRKYNLFEWSEKIISKNSSASTKNIYTKLCGCYSEYVEFAVV